MNTFKFSASLDMITFSRLICWAIFLSLNDNIFSRFANHFWASSIENRVTSLILSLLIFLLFDLYKNFLNDRTNILKDIMLNFILQMSSKFSNQSPSS